MHFDIEPDVTRARTLDKRFYLDGEAWTLARERIFARAWCWIGDLADVATPGSVSPRTLLPGLLDEPLLLARDASGTGAASAGTLRCLSNVCTHRGNLLVHEAATGVSGIRCGYHARRFDLAGRMTFMPGFEGACDFPAASDHLPEVAFEAWHGHGFARAQAAAALPSPSGPPTLAELLAPIAPRIGLAGLAGIDNWRRDPARDRSFEFEAHWALYVENYLEGLHIPHLHPGLAAAIDMASYRYELFPWCNLQVARARPGEPAFAPAPRPAGSPREPGAPQEVEPIGAYYFWVWPNLMLNFYPWGLSLNLVLPLSPTRTRVLFRGYVRDPSLTTRGAGGALDPVEMEDEAVVLTVQQGLRSRLYDRGRYSPRHERGVHHFHRLIAAAMAAG
ncbi:MAG: Rieske 2Fe-2S domain-containing protein [Rubrivivax sp.]|nr:Rieske 2Fe-2S domain-containing protein [Rubrivivax sp.]